MVALIAFASGLVFGLGLIVSGMANPAKVLGFLDIAGDWDPSLAFVMAGAIVVGVAAFALARRRQRSWLGLPMQWPALAAVTPRLLLGTCLIASTPSAGYTSDSPKPVSPAPISAHGGDGASHSRLRPSTSVAMHATATL